MGRNDYLTRMALGRSAFEDLQDPISTDRGHVKKTSDDPHITIDPDAPGYVQQYNSKGRPINPATEAHNAAMREAKNEVLALTGVVERKEEADTAAMLHDILDEVEGNSKKQLREREHDRGEQLDAVADFTEFFVTIPPSNLLEKTQVGMYAPSVTFWSILRSECRGIAGNGWSSAFVSLFPGLSVYLAHRALWYGVGGLTEEAVSTLQSYELKQKWKRRTSKRIHAALEILCETLLVALDVALLPLQYYTFARELGLTPAVPTRLLITSVLPNLYITFFTYGFRSPWSTPLGPLLSPAALVLLKNVIVRGDDEQAPFLASFTSFRYPPINGWPSLSECPRWTKDPSGYLLWHTYQLRSDIMRWCGWEVGTRSLYRVSNEIDDSRSNFENNSVDVRSPQTITTRRIRSTAMAHLPARWLGMRLDTFVLRVIMLPFERLMLRSIAASFYASSLPGSTAAIEAMPRLLGPLPSVRNALSRTVEWHEIGSYASKLGLSLALQAVVEVALFGGVYGLVRWQGRKNFGWRKLDEGTS